MDFGISQEFIDEQKANSKNLKKGGPYSKSDREKRRAEVYRLHFELYYSALKISHMMKINEKTIYDDIKFWNKKLASELFNADPNSLFMKQIKDFEAQKNRLIKKLEDKSANYASIERIILDVNSRLASFQHKLFFNIDRTHDEVIRQLNIMEVERETGRRWVGKYEIFRTTKETQAKIKQIMKQDPNTDDFMI